MDRADDVLPAGSVQLTRRNRQRSPARGSLRRCLLVVIVCTGIVTGCTAGSPPATDCFPPSVFTAEQMRARVDCHPNDYKLELDEQTVVLFAFPGPMLDWVGPIFVIHVPSVSEVVLDREGRIMFAGYKSPDGQAAIEQVINNPDLMARILAHVN